VLLHNGWGEGRSSHAVGERFKSLPNRLEISFFSYLEDQFYHGDFPLPYERILKLFQEGYDSLHIDEHLTYMEIVAGINPGGGVSVWLVGEDRTVEVFRGKAEKIKGDWKKILDNPNISREGFIAKSVNRVVSSEILEYIEKNGIPFGRWDNFSLRRPWKLVFTNFPLRKNRVEKIGYFNGEREVVEFPQSGEMEWRRPIPKKMVFVFAHDEKQGTRFIVNFEEEEIVPLFERLGADGQTVVMEHRVYEVDGKSVYAVYIKNGQEEVSLKRTRVEFYADRVKE
jgi:hypothetical protein